MKKTLPTLMLAVAATFAMAQTKTYTDNLAVTINGQITAPQQTTINVESTGNNTYKLSLLNFVMGSGEDAMPVGNIIVNNINAETVDGISTFATKQTVPLTPGNLEGVSFWLADMLTEIDIDLTGKISDGSLY